MGILRVRNLARMQGAWTGVLARIAERLESCVPLPAAPLRVEAGYRSLAELQCRHDCIELPAATPSGAAGSDDGPRGPSNAAGVAAGSADDAPHPAASWRWPASQSWRWPQPAVSSWTTSLRTQQHRSYSAGAPAPARDPSFAQLTSDDVRFFQGVLGLGGVVTDDDVLAVANTDWMNKYHGKSKLLLRPRTTEQVNSPTVLRCS